MGAPPATIAFTGVVLCGGASRRMGRDKALLEVAGVPMALRVADALRVAGATEVLAIGGDAQELAAFGLDVRPDDRPGDGPLPATITALQAAREPLVMVASCDLLYPDPVAFAATVRALADHPDASGAIPVVDGHHQWTHAAWRREVVAALVAAYDSGSRSLRRAGAGLLLCEVTDVSPTAVADADTPGDLAGHIEPPAVGG